MVGKIKKIARFIYFILFLSLFLSKTYSQQQDTVIVFNGINSLISKKGFLYQGIDNALAIPGMQMPGNISIHTNNGEAYLMDNKLYLMPEKKGFADVQVSWTKNIDTLCVLKKRFYVLAFPLPTLMVDNIKLQDGCDINRKIFMTSDSIHVFYSDDLLMEHERATISHYVLGYDYGSNFMKFEFEGKMITDGFREVVSRIPPGKEVSLRVYLHYQNGITASVKTFKTILY